MQQLIVRTRLLKYSLTNAMSYLLLLQEHIINAISEINAVFNSVYRHLGKLISKLFSLYYTGKLIKSIILLKGEINLPISI